MAVQTERTRTTVRLNEALLDQAKEIAEKKGTTLTALVEKGLRWVVENEDAPPRKRIVLRTGPPGHELMPGIDLNNGAQLQGILDEEDGYWSSRT
jgi:Family of unknown function (DUF6364)